MPLAPDEQPYDAQHFLDQLEDLFPEDWWGPMKANPDAGYELFQTFAAIAARCSLAVNRFEVGALAIFATGGTLAQAPVAFSRPSSSAGAVTVRAGTVVSTSKGDRRFVLFNDVVFGALDVGPLDAVVTAVATGWEWNVPGPVTRSSGEVLEGEIDAIVRPRYDPPYGDPTIYVAQTGDVIVLGSAPMLDGLADDRGLRRDAGESDASLSLRVRTLPDTVSPGAIRRMLSALLDPLNLPWDFIETFEHRYQECYDAPSLNAGTPTYQATPPTSPDFDTNLFCYDDPRNIDPFRNRWMDMNEYRGAFIVVLHQDITLHDVGMAYDDPGMSWSVFHPVGGPSTTHPWRATPAYDAPSDPTYPLVYAPCFDGFDLMRSAVYAAVANHLEQIRAGGVTAVVETYQP